VHLPFLDPNYSTRCEKNFLLSWYEPRTVTSFIGNVALNTVFCILPSLLTAAASPPVSAEALTSSVRDQWSSSLLCRFWLYAVTSWQS